MKNNLPSQFMLNRRTLGFLYLGAALSACGGGGSDAINNDEIPFNPEVIASNWSDTLPTSSAQEWLYPENYINVGASGLIYIKSAQGINQYKPDGTLVREISLPTNQQKNTNIYSISIIEDTSTNDIFIAVAYAWVVNFNSYATLGGFIARLTPQSSQVLFESNTVAPAGLARDKNGNLYFMDMKTGDVLRLAAASTEPTVIYRNEYDRSGMTSDTDFVFFTRCNVVVTDDGTVYAHLTAGYGRPGGSIYYPGILRLRNGQVNVINMNAGDIRGFGAYGNSIFVLTQTYPPQGLRVPNSPLIRKIDAAGVVSTVAGTPNAQGSTQFGSPGVLSKTTSWVGLSPDGRIHLQSWAKETPRFYSVRLPTQK